MAIYTKTGDKGQTSLANGERVSKADLRIDAYGTVDELNSWIGLLRTRTNTWSEMDSRLAWVQNKLFNLGAGLSCAPGEWIMAEDVALLEQWIDAMQSELPPMRAFVLPSGGEAAACCHVCRTICRRAERRMTEIEGCDELSLRFINRLSDFLFVLARFITHISGEKEEKWQK